MANGDDALAAGMDIVLGTEDIRMSYDETNKTRDYIAQRTSAVTSVAKGGTGASTPAAAKLNLEVVADKILRPGGDTIETTLLYFGANYATIADMNTGDATRLPLTGGTLSGHLYLPAATLAVSGYTAAFINGDGRVSRGASSARYKENITAAPELGNLFAVGLDEFEMIGGDGARILGYIAEKLAADPNLARFVIRDAEDRPDSIDWFQLLLAQNAQLHARLTTIEAALS